MWSWIKWLKGLGHTAEVIPRFTGETLPVHRIPPFPGQRVERRTEADVLIRKFGREVMVLQLPEGKGKTDHVVCFVHPPTQRLVFSSFGAGCMIDLNDLSQRQALPDEVIWDVYDRKTLTLVLMTNDRCCLLRPGGQFQTTRKMSEGVIDECRIEHGIVKATGWDRARRTAYPFEVRLLDGACRGGIGQG